MIDWAGLAGLASTIATPPQLFRRHSSPHLSLSLFSLISGLQRLFPQHHGSPQPITLPPPLHPNHIYPRYVNPNPHHPPLESPPQPQLPTSRNPRNTHLSPLLQSHTRDLGATQNQSPPHPLRNLHLPRSPPSLLPNVLPPRHPLRGVHLCPLQSRYLRRWHRPRYLGDLPRKPLG